MVTFTTLAESKCQEPLSWHVKPTPGSSTATATDETRPRRADWISRPILAASVAWEDELHAVVAAWAGAAANVSKPAVLRTTAADPINPRTGHIGILPFGSNPNITDASRMRKA
jgi:hypothetical protein